MRHKKDTQCSVVDVRKRKNIVRFCEPNFKGLWFDTQASLKLHRARLFA